MPLARIMEGLWMVANFFMFVTKRIVMPLVAMRIVMEVLAAKFSGVVLY